MNSYQLTLLVKNNLDEKERQELLDSITKSFEKLEKEDLWGVKDLAYPIRHQDKAYFVNYLFQAEPSKISSLDKKLKLNEDILRYLLVRR